MSMPNPLSDDVKYDWLDTENWFLGGGFCSSGKVPTVIGILIFG